MDGQARLCARCAGVVFPDGHGHAAGCLEHGQPVPRRACAGSLDERVEQLHLFTPAPAPMRGQLALD